MKIKTRNYFLASLDFDKREYVIDSLVHVILFELVFLSSSALYTALTIIGLC